MTLTHQRTATTIAHAIKATPSQAQAAIDLLDGGATVPFIARYRKEVTGGLDDTQLRLLATMLDSLRALEERRTAIVKTLSGLGVLTAKLQQAIESASSKAMLEDLYAPYKTKRATKASAARDKGLQPFADALREGRVDPTSQARTFAATAKLDEASVLAGARDILIDEVAQDAQLLDTLRQDTARSGHLMVRVPRGTDPKAVETFTDVLTRPSKMASLPTHRLLAVLRATKAGLLAVEAVASDTDAQSAKVGHALGVPSKPRTTGHTWLQDTAATAWSTRIKGMVSNAVLAQAREHAESAAVEVFAKNLKALLLAPPAGPKVTMGIDPGVRTGIKVAVVDATGKILATQTLYPFAPKRDLAGTKAGLSLLARRHQVELIAIGNGTGGRETQDVVRDTLQALARAGAPIKPQAFLISEAGASVYSASEAASRELPQLDVSLRGAVSIARRAQDPLAELIKIDPKALGIGQYQHDLPPAMLDRALADVVEDAVAAVGVDLNSASAALLAFVPGVGPALADAIVAHRDTNGPFANRKALLKVHRMGPKAFEQCAGFLRIRGGSEPLDTTGIHPESYALAKAILKTIKGKPETLIGKPEAFQGLRPETFATKGVGLPTVRAVLEELARPGRDPRGDFTVAQLDDAIQTIDDLSPGMVLEGTVTNVTTFGAFVDLGVHQDGLVHISQMAEHRVSDPHSVVALGQTVRVKVLEVDTARKRIALSLRGV